MSIVIMHVVKNNLYLMGDKRVSSTSISKTSKDGYEIINHNDNFKKVYKINDSVMIGAAGSVQVITTLRNNVLSCYDWDYTKYKKYFDSIFEKYYNYLDAKKISMYAKSFRMVLCGIVNGYFCSTVYQYPSKFDNKPQEKIFDLEENTFLTFCIGDLESEYKQVYMNQEIFKEYNFNETTISIAFKNTLIKMSETDKTISTTFDIYSIHIEEKNNG